MICTLWTPFQAERDWQNSYRRIVKIPLQYIFYSLCSLATIKHTIFSMSANHCSKHQAWVDWIREGVQSSSNSNHRHPNLFCGKRAPQLVISTTSNSNHHKILFYVIWNNALLTQFSTFIGVIWHLYWLKLNFQIIFRFFLVNKNWELRHSSF